ncbi:SH3 domain-containing protein [Clostridium aminobutyricum]|uniref:SH3 domain-containing protein n=1 Tax=Clostridium aminobutyricum TaxID=33953 RepID=A0A939D7W9_CLOAM|nr:SH3 domain-containing protein [Clostridium aminobutyricum]MBN7772847.1 hypothetical protein [Clostridium aminobutyricum]
MKPTIIIICLIVFTIGMTGCQNPSNNASDQSGETIPVETENQLSPQQEQAYDADFDKAYKEFVDAVHKKDLPALDRFLDDNILTSYGGERGKDYFYKYWNLNTNPAQSELWAELEKIISLGGSYSKEDRTFTAPYTYSSFPDEFDAFENFVVISQKVNVYGKKDLESKVIAYLNYNIIKVDATESDYWNKSDQDLIKIEMPSGKKGYVQKQFIRSPIDYRLSIIYKNNDEWKLTFMVAGD